MTNWLTVIRFYLTLLFFFSLAICSAQRPAADTLFLSKARAAAFVTYSEKIAEQSPLVNGSEYKEYFTSQSLTTGIPYFVSDDWIDGSVFYDSGLYTNVGLMFDELTEKLVVEQPFSHFKLELISEKIKYFQMAGHTFVRIVREKNDQTLLTGFYDLMYDGKTKTYVKREKKLKENPQVGGVLIEYLNHDSYLILKDNVYYPVRTKASVLNVFADKKRSLRKKMRAHSSELSFKRKRDTSIALIAQLYDESEN